MLSPNRKPQRTADGWIHILAYSKANFVALFEAGGRTDLVDDPRLQNRFTRAQAADSLYGEVVAVLATRTTEEWLAFCERHDIPAGRVASLDDLVAELPLAEHPLVGQTIASKYRIIRLLGEGGMGCVYQAEQMLGTTARKVAVKTLHKHLSHDESIKARFKREVGTVASV